MIVSVSYLFNQRKKGFCHKETKFFFTKESFFTTKKESKEGTKLHKGIFFRMLFYIIYFLPGNQKESFFTTKKESKEGTKLHKGIFFRMLFYIIYFLPENHTGTQSRERKFFYHKEIKQRRHKVAQRHFFPNVGLHYIIFAGKPERKFFLP